MRWPVLAVLVTLAPIASATMGAQTASTSGSGYGTSTGQLSARVEMSYLARNLWDGSRRTRWVQVVLLWRGQPGWAGRTAALDSVERRQAIDEYRRARAGAILTNATVLGGQSGAVTYLAQIDSASKAVTVLGQTFALPPRDSALIVLIDHIDWRGGQPAIVGTAVVDGRLPDLSPMRMWASGDTTFTVTPPDNLDEGLKVTLLRDPTVAAFWH